MSQHSANSLSILDLQAMKQRGEKISCLTAYDASFSALIDQAGIDVILIGDSLGMVIQGSKTTLSVTLEHILYHTRCVCEGRNRAFVIADLPFMTYHSSERAAENAARIFSESGAQMVKLEGPRFEIVRYLVDQGLPVCGHLGLLPQSINLIGGFHAQGKNPEAAELILEQAIELERAGASMLLLECVPADLAKEITCQLDIPVIGIGAGPDCDGQILVLYDILHIGKNKIPRFAKDFSAQSEGIRAAIEAYHNAVKTVSFPAQEHCF